MASALEEVRSSDAHQIGEELTQSVKRCRTMAREGSFLLKLTLAERAIPADDHQPDETAPIS